MNNNTQQGYNTKQFSLSNLKIAMAIIAQIAIIIVAAVTQYFTILDDLQNLKDRVGVLEGHSKEVLAAQTKVVLEEQTKAVLEEQYKGAFE